MSIIRVSDMHIRYAYHTSVIHMRISHIRYTYDTQKCVETYTDGTVNQYLIMFQKKEYIHVGKL